jgi:AraC family transcriptional regulator of adaptative response/methylated-DNA-[protein]-cysteine methyltransferase
MKVDLGTSRHAAAVTAACLAIEKAEDTPSLAEIAAVAGLSPFHFQRVFKQATGVTPKEYASARRAEKVRERLTKGGSVTDAIYDAGFNSSGRFHENSRELLGTPSHSYRQGGKGEIIRFAIGDCSLGAFIVAASEKGVCCIMLDDDPEFLLRELQNRFRNAELVGADRDFEDLVAKVVALVEMPNTATDLPLDIRGTAFQQRVWQALREIPAGTTLSYSEVADKIGSPKSARAVAGACAANYIAIVIPCHRLVCNDGSLSGYRWGVERKHCLLDREST